MYNLTLTPEQIEFRDTIKGFARNKIRPIAIHPDRLEPFAKPLLVDLLDEASQLGTRTLTLSEDLGGVGAGTLTACIVFEELAAGDIDIAVTLAQSNLLGKFLFEQILPEKLRDEHLPQFVEDDQFHLAFATDGEGHYNGWSYRRNKTVRQLDLPQAVREGNDWILNGNTKAIINAPIAKLLIVEAVTDRSNPDQFETSLFIVPPRTEGLVVQPSPEAIGEKTENGEEGISWHHGTVTKCALNNCKISENQRLTIGESYRKSREEFETSKAVLFSAINLGIAAAAVDAAIDYAKIRYQGGYYLIEHQSIGEKIADMQMKLELARSLVWKSAWVLDNPEAIYDGGLTDLPYHIMAQVNTAETVNEVALTSAELFGAMGVMRDMPLQKYVHDSFIFLNSSTLDSATKLLISESAVAFERP